MNKKALRENPLELSVSQNKRNERISNNAAAQRLHVQPGRFNPSSSFGPTLIKT
jgi:hypothetical protein